MFQDFDLQKLKIKRCDGKKHPPAYEIGRDTPADLMEAKPNTDLLPYPANCHCGAVQYIIHMPELKQANCCNCSICSRNGYLTAYPDRANVVFYSGESHLRSYTFGKKSMPHKFCPTCGSSILIDINGAYPGRDALAVNVSFIKNYVSD